MIIIQGADKREHESAVSPVVGVMLMLVVTIIIAAVVSGFAGGLFGTSNNMKTPALAMDVKIVKMNATGPNSFTATVLSASEPIPTSKLKVSTSWVKNATYFGGGDASSQVPYGFGPGVKGDISLSEPYNKSQWFGNYTITQGTGLVADSGSAMTVMLGNKYSNLSVGDVVSVRVIYVPTGKAIFQRDVAITEG